MPVPGDLLFASNSWSSATPGTVVAPVTAVNDGLLIQVAWGNGGPTTATEAIRNITVGGVALFPANWTVFSFANTANRKRMVIAANAAAIHSGAAPAWSFLPFPVGGFGQVYMTVSRITNVRAWQWWDGVTLATATGTSAAPLPTGMTTANTNSLYINALMTQGSTATASGPATAPAMHLNFVRSIAQGTGGFAGPLPLATIVPGGVPEAWTLPASDTWETVDIEAVDITEPAFPAPNVDIYRESIEVIPPDGGGPGAAPTARIYRESIEVMRFRLACPSITQCCSNDPSPIPPPPPTYAPPTFVGAEISASGVNTLTPPAIQVGDILITEFWSEQGADQFGSMDFDGTTLAATGGWQFGIQRSCGGNHRWLAYKIATAAEAGALAYNYTGAALFANYSLAVFRDHSGFELAVVANETSPGIVTTQDNSRVFHSWVANATPAPTPGAPYLGNWGPNGRNETFDEGVIATAGTVVGAVQWVGSGGCPDTATFEIRGLASNMPRFEQFTEFRSASTNLVQIPRPGALAVGDHMIAWLGRRAADLVTVSPSGWTQIAGPTTAGASNTSQAWEKVADAGDVAAVTFDWTFAGPVADTSGIIVRTSNQATPAVGINPAIVTTIFPDATLSTPALTTTSDNSLVYRFAHSGANYGDDPLPPVVEIQTHGSPPQAQIASGWENGLVGATALPARDYAVPGGTSGLGWTVEILADQGTTIFPPCDVNFIAGASIFIQGTDFGAVQGASTVDYYAGGGCGGTILGTLAIVSWSDTLIEATLPGVFPGSGIDVGVNVPSCPTVCCGTIGAVCPSCSSITPNPIFPGTLVSINGASFGALQDTREIRIYDQGCDFGPFVVPTPTFWSDTLVQFVMPNLTTFGTLHIAVVEP